MIAFIASIPPWIVVCLALVIMLATEIARELMGGNQLPQEFPRSTSYDLTLDCYRSGQMSERQWQEHLKDEHFAAWIHKKRDEWRQVTRDHSIR